MQHYAAYELNAVMAHTQYALRCFPYNGESFGKNVVQGFTLIEQLFKIRGLFSEVFVGKLFYFAFQCFYFICYGLQPLNFLIAVAAKYSL